MANKGDKRVVRNTVRGTVTRVMDVEEEFDGEYWWEGDTLVEDVIDDDSETINQVCRDHPQEPNEACSTCRSLEEEADDN